MDSCPFSANQNNKQTVELDDRRLHEIIIDAQRLLHKYFRRRRSISHIWNSVKRFSKAAIAIQMTRCLWYRPGPRTIFDGGWNSTFTTVFVKKLFHQIFCVWCEKTIAGALSRIFLSSRNSYI